MKFIEELKRRNVIKATMAYIVVAWVLIQVLTNILPIFQAPPWVLQTLMILLAIGLPVWIFFSWVYDVTPEGIKKTENVPTDGTVTATTNKRLNIVILIMLAIAIGMNFIDTSGNRTASSDAEIRGEVRDNSIAVLPFLDMSPLKDQEYFSDGIAIEILNSLCKFNTLKVVGQTSSFSFKGKNEDIKSIGEKLNVNNILEGSVQKQQDRIRISVRLTDSQSGYTVFSESYSDALENIFDLQALIAKDIAEKIESELAIEDNELYPRKKIDPQAYETFLIGKSKFVNGPLNMNTREALEAKKYFERAVALDSSFAEANAYLALIYFNLVDWAIPNIQKERRQAALDSARLLARRAHSIDSLSSGAHLATGSMFFHEYRWSLAEREKRRAVELNPGGADEKFILSSFLSQFGQGEEALALDREAMILDPLNPSAELHMIRDLYYSERYEDVISHSLKLLEGNPSSSGAYQFLFLAYGDLGQLDDAGRAMAKWMELVGMKKEAEFFNQHDYKTAVHEIMAFDEKEPLPFLARPIAKAILYSFLKDEEKTIEYLQEVYENHDSHIAYMQQRKFRFLKEDPRYQDLYKKAGFQAYYDR